MFSRRAGWDRAPNEIALLRDRLARDSTGLIDLTESNPTRCGFSYPTAEILEALSAVRDLRYEPDPKGAAAARAAIAETLPLRIDPERILLAGSTSEAYSWLIKLLCDPGDRLLVPAPSYPLLEMLARLEAVEIDAYPLLREASWRIDLDWLAERVAPTTKAIVVIQPNNPTGTCLAPEERAALFDLAARRGIAMISDEVFLDYPAAAGLLAERSLLHDPRALLFVLGGLSKSAGLPQLKCSWIAVEGPAAPREEALARLELIADAFLPVSAPVQRALPDLIRIGRSIREQILARIRTNRAAILRERDGSASWDLLPADGGWAAMLRLPGTRNDLEWTLRILERDRVLVHPGHFYDAADDPLLVLSLLPPEEMFRSAIGSISRRIASDAG